MLKRLFASRRHPYIPGLNKPERIEIDLSGAKLCLQLPPHHDYEGFEAMQTPIPKVNIYDQSIYRDSTPEDPFSSSVFIKRGWEYYGPIWRMQPVASTTFIAVVEQVNCLPEGMSCFNPHHLEQALIHLIYEMGPNDPLPGVRLAPVNWVVRAAGETQWTFFEVHQDLARIHAPNPSSAASYSSYAVTPLDDRYYLRLMFHNHGYVPVGQAIYNMNTLRDKVCRNIVLQLSPSAQAQMDRAQRCWPDARISPQREPENWVYPEWRYGESGLNEPLVVILKPGSAPPPFDL
ncbi:conserved hypothetical protein [Hahella chejuensis KCTC 2396]|uniref:Uncharacterized protein n=1 Tax=Hahella chejuensis (strain KCTC 2396) TaxID=349521 RepID=Q2SFZ5_HAHCH|nr:hypothetical protein [Hahella chejuensis]ABC30429.1 conserved hypothetical protein [Hahella chejuensis KCTC 2396]